MGLYQKRDRSQLYDDLIDEFMKAITDRYPVKLVVMKEPLLRGGRGGGHHSAVFFYVPRACESGRVKSWELFHAHRYVLAQDGTSVVRCRLGSRDI